MLSCSVMSNSLLTPRTAPYQAPLSMGFPRQEYWSGLPFPSPGDLPDPRVKPVSLAPPALAGRFFSTVPRGNLPGRGHKSCDVWELISQEKSIQFQLLGIRIVRWAFAMFGQPTPFWNACFLSLFEGHLSDPGSKGLRLKFDSCEDWIVGRKLSRAHCPKQIYEFSSFQSFLESTDAETICDWNSRVWFKLRTTYSKLSFLNFSLEISLPGD